MFAWSPACHVAEPPRVNFTWSWAGWDYPHAGIGNAREGICTLVPASGHDRRWVVPLQVLVLALLVGHLCQRIVTAAVQHLCTAWIVGEV